MADGSTPSPTVFDRLALLELRARIVTGSSYSHAILLASARHWTVSVKALRMIDVDVEAPTIDEAFALAAAALDERNPTAYAADFEGAPV